MQNFDKELNNRGGYLDYLVDEHWLKADSKAMRALRAFAIQASLSRIASVSPKGECDRQLMAIRIGSTTVRADIVLLCAFGQKNPIPVTAAANNLCFYFDSAMLNYSTALFDLAMVALPLEDAKHLINLVPAAVTNPASAIAFLHSLVKVAKEGLKYGRIVGALYRDTIELEVQIWLEAPKQYGSGRNAQVPDQYRVTESMVANLRKIYSRGNDNMAAWHAELAALRSTGLEPIPDAKFVGQLAALLKYMCGLITRDDGSLTICLSGLDALMAVPIGSQPPAKKKEAGLRYSPPQSAYVWRYTPRILR